MNATSRTMKTYTSLYVVGCVTLGAYMDICLKTEGY